MIKGDLFLFNYLLIIFLLDILKSILNSISTDPKSWIYSLIIGWITFAIVKYYYKVGQHPSGPFPMPFIGNFLCKLFIFISQIEFYFVDSHVRT